MYHLYVINNFCDTDDLRKPSGQLAGHVAEFGNSWLFDESGDQV